MSKIADLPVDMAQNGMGDSTVAVQNFIRAVGERMRQARQECGLSQRSLSDLSGISLRYLAQLENGGGNISIGLLFKLAHALGRPVDWFFGGASGIGSDTADMIRLLGSADAAKRRRVREILEAGNSVGSRKRRIGLIGVRGAGKSTIGREAGEVLSLPFVELNSDIEEQSGMPVEEVLALYGQEGFRALEYKALERIASTTSAVIVAVAGGIVSDPDGYEFLLQNFHTIWIKATPEEHMNRVRAQGDYRPMAGNPKAMEELQVILTSREALYQNAEHTVNTSGRAVDESVREVVGVIEEFVPGDSGSCDSHTEHPSNSAPIP